VSVPDSVVVLAVGAVVLVAFLVYRAVVASRERREARAQGLLALGFEALPGLPEEATQALRGLLRRPAAGEYEIRDVFARPGPGHVLYLLEIVDTSEDGSRRPVVAVVSDRLDLPRFALSPRLEQPGALAGLANRVLEQILRRSGSTVRFPDDPDFDRRCLVSGDDEGRLRTFFTPRRRERIARTGPMLVEGEGRIFTCQRLALGPRAAHFEQGDVTEARVRDAQALFDALSSASAEP
jgi:hypothetical protein